MNRPLPSWLKTADGEAPGLSWLFSTDAPLAALQYARESGETIAADTSGGLYRFDRNGELTSLSRGFHGLQLLAGDDVGRHRAAVVEEVRLLMFDAELNVVWTLELPEVVTALAVESHGEYVAVSLADGKNVVYDAYHQRMFHFETERPLRFLQFLATQPGLLGGSEYGLLGRWDFSGSDLWTANLRMNVGEMCCTGEGRRIFLAAFNEGIKLLGGSGERRGALLLEGTPNHISTSFVPNRIAATTLEGHLYWLDDEGDFVWGAELPEEAVAVRVHPLGNGLLCGLLSGRLVSLVWEA